MPSLPASTQDDAPRAGISRRRPRSASDRATQRHLQGLTRRPGVTQILSRLPDAVVTFDREWRYVFMNRQALLNHGRPAGEFLGRSVWEVFPEGKLLESHRRYLRAMERQQEDVYEEYLPMFGRWFEQRLFPSEQGLTVIARDITEWHEVRQGRSQPGEPPATARGGDPCEGAAGREGPADDPGNPIRTFTTFFARQGKRDELVARIRELDVFGLAARESGALALELQVAEDPKGPLVVTALWKSAADRARWESDPSRASVLAHLGPLVDEICVEKYEVVRSAAANREA